MKSYDALNDNMKLFCPYYWLYYLLYGRLGGECKKSYPNIVCGERHRLHKPC